MGDTSIRLSREAKRRLELAKREGESFDDVVMRLTGRDKWAAFGLLADGEDDPREAMEGVHRRMNEEMARDIEEMGSR